ncbi:helix-turn-helix domain-containing protein [Chryseobacterium sp. SIMBA_028]|uniref:helix-turn-helix domain-containing protein n=1 Tax=Chryseobacterium sp. SIMBA_028 TaxID=3085771 RepID=UPI00397D38A3
MKSSLYVLFIVTFAFIFLSYKPYGVSSIEQSSLIVIVLLVGLLVLVSILYYKARKKNEEHENRAHELAVLLNELKDNNIEDSIFYEEDNVIIDNTVADHLSKKIPEEIVQNILHELTNFEIKKLFLEKGITLSSLAKEINTNRSYLSIAVNSHKAKNFTAYLNDLRVNYAIAQITEDSKLRSYKISGIADELGYNNEQAFCIAFKKKTGTTVSAFIKEINNTEHNLESKKG